MPEEGGDPACWLEMVCDTCGTLHPPEDTCAAAALDRQEEASHATGGTAGELEALDRQEEVSLAAGGTAGELEVWTVKKK